jgi:hypothetical protein
MIFSKKDNITILTRERASIPQLVKKINDSYKKISNDNLIINLTTLDKLNSEEIIEFLEISNIHRKSKHSFVLVNNTIDVEETPDEINVVPTLQEAFDIIEMEEMERDLGL